MDLTLFFLLTQVGWMLKENPHTKKCPTLSTSHAEMKPRLDIFCLFRNCVCTI